MLVILSVITSVCPVGIRDQSWVTPVVCTSSFILGYWVFVAGKVYHHE